MATRPWPGQAADDLSQTLIVDAELLLHVATEILARVGLDSEPLAAAERGDVIIAAARAISRIAGSIPSRGAPAALFVGSYGVAQFLAEMCDAK
ncbi:hypothetical protein ACVWZV_004423 [Bradyrhizobium sp. GM5.1]